jgi:hypothetical protein
MNPKFGKVNEQMRLKSHNEIINLEFKGEYMGTFCAVVVKLSSETVLHISQTIGSS